MSASASPSLSYHTHRTAVITIAPHRLLVCLLWLWSARSAASASASSSFSCERSKWEERLDSDLGTFEENGISIDALRAAEKQPCGGYLVSIVDGKLYAFPLGWAKKEWPMRPGRTHLGLAMIARMLCTYGKDLPKVSFVINAYDRLCSTGWHSAVPTISWGKETVGDDHQILMPYWTFFDVQHYLKDVDTAPAWEDRKSVAVWRGATTGGLYGQHNWQDYPRSRLVSICNNSRICDAKFTGYPQATVEGQKAVKDSGAHGDPMTLSTLLQHKYVIVNDGNMAPSSRLFIYLQSGSVILKQESPAIEFYYDDLQPYKHYIPVAYNFGDIEQKIRWAIRNDERSKTIAANARAYAKRYLTRQHVDCFMYRLLLRYARAQRPMLLAFAGYHNSSWQEVTQAC